MIGIDLNADHIAICETDPSGNPISTASLYYEWEGKSSEQLTAILADHVAHIVDLARLKGKTLACEELDFTKKKAALRELNGRRFRKLISSFAYKKFYSMLQKRAARHQVRVKAVKATFTSIIGFYKFRGYSGYSSHELAALAIARRAQGYSERARTKVGRAGTVSIQGVGDSRTFHQESPACHTWSFYSRKKTLIRASMVSSMGKVEARFYHPRYRTGYMMMCLKDPLRPNFCEASLPEREEVRPSEARVTPQVGIRPELHAVPELFL